MLHRRCAQTSGLNYTLSPMALIEIEVEEGENSDMSLMRIFDSIEEPREVSWVVALRRDGTEGPCAVTDWSAAAAHRYQPLSRVLAVGRQAQGRAPPSRGIRCRHSLRG